MEKANPVTLATLVWLLAAIKLTSLEISPRLGVISIVLHIIVPEVILSDDKLENLLQNLKVLAVSFKNTAEFSKSNSKIRTSEIHKDKVDAYVAKIENYFLIKRDNKVNEDLLDLIKEENYLINTNNIKTALNNY